MNAVRPGYGVRLESAARLLETHTPVATVEEQWSAPMRLSAYLGDVDLPTEIPGRVRCLVTDGETVLITWDAAGPKCLPGGGAKPGETVVETARREVWEETGWWIDPESVETLGWIHVESLVEAGDAPRYPHPDDFHKVVTARPSHPDEGHEDWVDTEGHVDRSEFVPLDLIPGAVLANPVERAFLYRATGAGLA